MRYLYIKDKKRKYFFKNYEKNYLLTKYFLIKYNLYLKNEFFKYKLYFIKKYFVNFFVKLKNRCIFSYSSYSIYMNFKLSRIYLRHMLISGKINGFKKSSW